MDTIMSTKLCFLSQSDDAFTDQWQGWRNIQDEWGVSIESQGSTKCYLMSCDHQIDDIWEARFERKPEHKVYNPRAEPEMGNFKRILLSHWMKHLVQKHT